MARIERFEQIEAWQKARELTRFVYAETSTGKLSRDFKLKDQIRSASVSIMANIAEGFERGGDNEFKQFLAVAKGSAGEVKSHLYVALDAGFIKQESFDTMFRLADDASRLIGAFMTYLKRSVYRGPKHSTE